MGGREDARMLPVALKMQRLVVVSLLTLLLTTMTMMKTSATGQDNLTTVDKVFFDVYRKYISHIAWKWLLNETNDEYYKYVWKINSLERPVEAKDLYDVVLYLSDFKFEFMSQFVRKLKKITVQSVVDDINVLCSQQHQKPIRNVTDEIGDVTCATHSMLETLTSRFKETISATLHNFSGGCIEHTLSICSAENRNCTVAHQERLGRFTISYMEDLKGVIPFSHNTKTPLHIIYQYIIFYLPAVSRPFIHSFLALTLLARHTSVLPSIQPYALENLLHTLTNNVIKSGLIKSKNNTFSEGKFSWGIVKKYSGSVDLFCSNYKDIYTDKKSPDFWNFFFRCNDLNMMRLLAEQFRCLNDDPSTQLLTWSTVPSFYVHSECLCLASSGADCGVNAPPGVDPSFYCMSVLLRDFQRQVWYRPAVTYLDYAFQARIPVCTFFYLLTVKFTNICRDTVTDEYFYSMISSQCYFQGLVNKDLNCTEPLVMDSYNYTELCAAVYFSSYVFCDDDEDHQASVFYFGPGDSSVVLLLTYFNLAMRILTLVTYVACPQLRNLSGKLLIAYQLTALSRLLVVRATLEDLSTAVRIDVAMDLASTSWLSAYLYFMTRCIMDLRPPNSLTPEEVRVVLFRSALLGWILPAALSAAFFYVDDFFDSRFKVGQLLFLVCIYAALCGNLVMFYKNFKFYYQVRSDASKLQRHKARRVFADMFNFAVKTSVLSGAGIIFRLIFIQIQGLEQVLGYYHALGTLHGLLLFLLYGCNSEARDFWSSVLRSILLRCRKTPLEPAEIPMQNVAPDDHGPG